MNELISWVPLIALVVAPLASIIWLYLSWNRFKETVPFTPEHDKKKRRFIIAAVIAGIFVCIYIVVMVIYGVKVFFAPSLS
jgi:predicted secreted protein